MRHLLLALSTVILAALAGWAQSPQREQGRLSVDAHRQEAHNQASHHHHRRHHRHHHNHHPGA